MANEIVPGAEQNLEALRRLVDPDIPEAERFDPEFVDHDDAVGQPEGPAGPAWYWQQFGRSFSQVERQNVEMVVTPGHIVTVSTISGTHTGEWLGHVATGKRFTVRNVQVTALRDGRPYARWGSTDELGILRQLGLLQH